MFDINALFPGFTLPSNCEYEGAPSRHITLNADGTFSGVHIGTLKYGNGEGLADDDIPVAYQITQCRDTEVVCRVGGLVISPAAILVQDKQGSGRAILNGNLAERCAAVSPYAAAFIDWLYLCRLNGRAISRRERNRAYVLITDCICKDLHAMTAMKRTLIRELDKESCLSRRAFALVAYQDINNRPGATASLQMGAESNIQMPLPNQLFKRRENDPYSLFPVIEQETEAAESGYQLYMCEL